nr:11771_t:CDS:2 [Entrophospora candida]
MTEQNTSISEKNKLIIDREKIAPFLLRVFCRPSYHHRLDDYTPEHLPIDDEIANLIKKVNQDASRPNARLSFKLAYIDNLRGRYVFKELGVVHNSTSSTDDGKNLDDARFVIGDLLDVTVLYEALSDSVIERHESLRDRDRDHDNRYRGGGSGRNFRTRVDNNRDYRDRARNRDSERDHDRDRNGSRRIDRRDDRRDGGRSFRDRR